MLYAFESADTESEGWIQMRIVFVASEAVPWAKTGGLADVAALCLMLSRSLVTMSP